MTTIQPSSHRSWTRVLHDDHDDSFDPRVFWSVNALLLTLLLIFLVWCYRGGAEKISIYLTREAAGLSDAEYLERVRERREREAEEKKETPEQRLKSLKKSFQRNKVHMVVESHDFVEESVVEIVENESVVEQVHNVGSGTEVETSEKEQESGEGTSADIENGARIDEEDGKAVILNPEESESANVVGETTDKDGQATAPLSVGLGSPDSDDSTNADQIGGESSSIDSLELGSSDNAQENAIAEQDQIFAMNTAETGAPGYIKLRLPSGKRRTVPNLCAVCLCHYEEEETVVWSSNRACKHAFHEECVMEWLIKMQDGTPCPCCRQEFTDLDRHKQMKKKVLQPQASFDVSVIRL